MGADFLKRVRSTSLLSALVLFPGIATYLGLGAGFAWLVGCAWSLVNLIIIRLLIDALYREPQKHQLRVTLIFFLKVPALYAAGFLMLKVAFFPIEFLLAGFVWPLVVMTLKVLGRMILRADAPKNEPTVTERHP